MELRHIRYFVAVAEELHFGRAAQRLRISQPPLSQQIQTLEREVGARLFERSKHKVKLTKAGEAMLVEAYRLLDQAERVRSTARQASSGLSIRLNIGCVSSVFFNILPRILDRVHVRHPQIGFSVFDFETSSALPALMQGRLDVGFCRVESVERPLEARLLMRDHFLAALHVEHPLTRHKRIPLARLAGEPLIILSRQISPRPYDWIIAGCLKAGFNPNIEYQSASIQSQIGLAACGLGVALVPHMTKDWRVPQVVYRELDEPIRATDLALVWNTTAHSEALQLFLEAVDEVFPHDARTGRAANVVKRLKAVT